MLVFALKKDKSTLKDTVADKLQDPRDNVDGKDPVEERLLVHACENSLPSPDHQGHQHEHARLHKCRTTPKRKLMEK